jgi:hypothetical protein
METVWEYAIKTYGEDGLWLGKRDKNHLHQGIEIRKFGVLKEVCS